MRCSVCGEEVSARADFCAGCGAQLAAVTGDLSSLPDAAPTAAPPDRDTVTAAATSPLTTSSAATGSETPTSATPTPGSGRDTGPLSVGQSFGRYHIIRLLGMGVVYQAWHEQLEIAVAIKVIRPQDADDPHEAEQIEKRFKRELVLARQVTHKHVVRIHDLGEIDGIKYISMPYIQGSNL